MSRRLGMGSKVTHDDKTGTSIVDGYVSKTVSFKIALSEACWRFPSSPPL